MPNTSEGSLQCQPGIRRASAMRRAISGPRGMTPPYVVAGVELIEQKGLRILPNIVDCDPELVAIGMPNLVLAKGRHLGDNNRGT
jgi:hypothetical protein